MKDRKMWVSILAGILALAMVLSLLLSLIPTRAYAKTSGEIQGEIDDLKDKQTQLQEKMEDLRAQQEENQNQTTDIVSQKSAVDQQIGLLYIEISNIEQQIASYNQLIADKQDELDAAQAELDALSEKNKERIRAMEENGSLSYWSVLFKASSFADLLDRLNMMQEIAASDQRRIEQMNQAARTVEQARQTLEENKAALEETRAGLDASQTELAEKQSESQTLLTKLIENGQELQQLMEEYESQEDALIDQIGEAEQAYNEAKQAEWEAANATKPTSPDNSGSSSGGSSGSYPVSDEGWMIPCSYVYISGTYGWREAPTEGASSYHTGIDLAGAAGTPIYASRSGEVTRGGYNEYNGYYVGINHGDGFSSVYLHMTTYVVEIGDYVTQGQLIGYMGETGIATGPHLHLTIYYNGETVNPADFIF